MVRLVFRAFSQVKRTICRSASLRPSAGLSPGFALLKQGSPSLGSWHLCSYSNHSEDHGRLQTRQTRQSHQATLVQLTSLPAIFWPFLTLFSKSFASFLHSTCSLSAPNINWVFRWSLPPTLRSTPKERDSESANRTSGTAKDRQDAHLLW